MHRREFITILSASAAAWPLVARAQQAAVPVIGLIGSYGAGAVADPTNEPQVAAFRKGLAESLPVGDAWADVVISNGVINLCASKRRAFNEVMRVLQPGGRLQFADIATGRTVPEAAVRNIDLWTD